MLILECTKKLAEQLRINLQEVKSNEVDPFYKWHANLFIHQRRKYVILMNNLTRYCVVIYSLKKEQFKDFGKTVVTAIRNNLLAEGFEQSIVDRYIENCHSVVYAKTYDRSILGQMNDMVFLALSYWENEEYDEIAMNKILNRTPMVKAKYPYGIDGFKELLAKIDLL